MLDFKNKWNEAKDVEARRIPCMHDRSLVFSRFLFLGFFCAGVGSAVAMSAPRAKKRKINEGVGRQMGKLEVLVLMFDKCKNKI